MSSTLVFVQSGERWVALKTGGAARVEAVQTGREQISDEAVESWQTEFDFEAAFA